MALRQVEEASSSAVVPPPRDKIFGGVSHIQMVVNHEVKKRANKKILAGAPNHMMHLNKNLNPRYLTKI